MTELHLEGRTMPTRRTQQQRRAETEQRVLAATQRIILEQGPAAVTLAAVGETAGYSRGIVNHAFGSRQALIRTLAELLQERLAVEVAGGGGDGLHRVLRWVEAYLSALQYRADDARAFLMLWLQATTSEPELNPIFVDRDTAFRDALAADITAGLADCSIYPSGTPTAMAVAIISQLRGTGIQLLLAHDPTPLDTVHQAVANSITRALEATTPPH